MNRDKIVLYVKRRYIMAKKKKKQRKTDKKSEVFGVAVILIAVLLLISLFVGSDSLLKKFADGTMRGVFGLGAYIVPLLIAAFGVLLIAGKRIKIHPGKITMTVLMLLALVGLVHTVFSWFTTVGTAKTSMSFSDALIQAYTKGKTHIGMGAFASLYVYPLSALVSDIGAFAVFLAIIIIALIVLFNLSLQEAGEKVGKHMKDTGDKMRESIHEANARRLEARHQRNYDFELSKDDDEADKADESDETDGDDASDGNVIPSHFEVKPVRRESERVIRHIGFDENAEAEQEEKPEEKQHLHITEYTNDDTPESDKNGSEQEETSASELDGNAAYQSPAFSLLNVPVGTKKAANTDHSQKIEMMESTLKSFGINAWVENITVGPAITRYELSIERGTRVSKVLSLSDDIALSMAAVGVRIEAPIPGKSAIGIEIPNDTVSMVSLREVLESDAFKSHPSPVAVGLGKDITGKAVIADLAKMPHLLIAGQTGSGKSVCINSIITSLLYKSSPKDVKLILVDPKKVELNVYNGIPHLMTPVVSDPKKAAGALQFVVREMEKRYEVFARTKVKDIVRYNELAAERGEEPMPRIVVIVDELNDLMIVARGEVEDSVMRIAQLARAAGIYLILATQRPSVNVITGVIKANIPSRIAFAVAQGVDSKTILDTTGAEKLVGKGDMLYHLSGAQKPSRVQGAFVSEQEIEKVVEFIKAKNAEAKYIGEEQLIMREIKPNHGGSGENPNDSEDGDSDEDELFPAAVEYAIECGNVSISALQRRFKVGYSRAGRLIDSMEMRGIVEASQGAKARKVLVTREQFWEMYDERLD